MLEGRGDKKRNIITTWVIVFMNRGAYLFRPKPGERHREHEFYRKLYPSIIKDIQVIFVFYVFLTEGLNTSVTWKKFLNSRVL